jgi:hypothetical protein
MVALMLDEHRSMFRSDADFDRFVSLLEAAGGQTEMTPVWAKQRHLVTLLSQTQVHALVREKMLQTILDNPSLLDEMKDRLENDPVVE